MARINGDKIYHRMSHKPGIQTTRHRILGLLWDRKIVAQAPNYLFQSALATVSLIVILLVEDTVLRAAIVVAVASTAFTIFVVPNSVAASPRRVIGGHLVAVIAGTIFWSLLSIPALASASEESRYVLDIMAALSVGLSMLLLSMLLMVATDTEHPPAAGTALGLVIYEWSWSAVVFILVSSVVLSAVRIALRPRLVNLI